MADTKSIEDWAAQKQTQAWLLAAAKQRSRWGEGRQLSEADFDAGVAGVQGIQLSGYADQQRLTQEAQRQAAEALEQKEAQAREASLSKTVQQQIGEAQAAAPAPAEVPDSAPTKKEG